MTGDEFERVLIAACQMRTWNINGETLVSLKGLIDIVQSQLHPEDRDKWIFTKTDTQIGWKKRET